MKQELFDQLCALVKACSLCPTIENRGRAVPPEGDVTSPVLFLGRNPGREELKQSRPFVGPGGKCLDKFIEAAGLIRSKTLIANTVCCFTADDRPPLPSEVETCSPFLRSLIWIQKPQLIVVLGKLALQSIVFTTDSPVHCHGTIYDSLIRTPHGLVETKAFCSWHPGSAVRSSSVMKDYMEDASKLRQYLISQSILTP